MHTTCVLYISIGKMMIYEMRALLTDKNRFAHKVVTRKTVRINKQQLLFACFHPCDRHILPKCIMPFCRLMRTLRSIYLGKNLFLLWRGPTYGVMEVSKQFLCINWSHDVSTGDDALGHPKIYINLVNCLWFKTLWYCDTVNRISQKYRIVAIVGKNLYRTHLQINLKGTK